MESLRTIIKKLIPRRVLAWLAHLRHEHVHHVVSNTHDAAAFCVVGNSDQQTHLARIYLGAVSGYRVRRGVHWQNWSALALEQARCHGLVAASDVTIPATLEPVLLRLPKFVALSIKLPESVSELRQNLSLGARSDIRRINRGGFQCEVHNNADWASEFYTRYHEKAITSRHGMEGYVLQAKKIANLVANEGWEFICVTREGKRLAATLCDPLAEGYRLGRLGWLDGNPELVKEGVLTATYWFSLLRACELGKSYANFGATPPYIEDGLFQYKTKWGAELNRKDTVFGMQDVLLDPTHPQVRAMLAKRSIIGLDKDDRFVVYSGRDPREVNIPRSIQQNIARWYRPDPEGKPFAFTAVPEWPLQNQFSGN